MCFKPNERESLAKARESLHKREERTPTEVSRGPRGNREPDEKKRKRAEQRLLSVVGN
jgi:hypothetical protein